MEHGAEVVRVANDDDHVVGIVLDLKRITFWDMGKRGCATYGRNGVVWVENSKIQNKNQIARYGEKGACDIWEKWGCLGGEIKDSKTRIKLRDMGKRGCATYGRNGVVWVEKSNT